MKSTYRLKLGMVVALLALVGAIGWQWWRTDDASPVPSDEAVASRPLPAAVKTQSVSAGGESAQPAAKRGNRLSVAKEAAQEAVKPAAAAAVAKLPVVENAPPCPRYRDTPVHAYRSSKLLPKAKGGAAGELREWLVKPEAEGYEYHVEEEYYPDENGELVLVRTSEYVANQVTLIVDGEVKDAEFAAKVAEFGARFKDTLMEVDKGKRIVAVDMPEVTLDAVAKLEAGLASVSGATCVSRDFVRHRNTTSVNDPFFTNNYQWGLKKINAPGAWDIVKDASSVVVAVLDTGINYNHEDLAGNMWVNPSLGGQGFGSSDRYGAKCLGGVKSGNPLDDNDHGSNCAGIIGMVGNNSKGGSGVAWKVKLMALKCFSASGSSTTVDSDSMALLSFARAKGAHIVNCSFGGYGYSDTAYAAYSALRTAGIIAVCASGNEGNDTDSTPHYPSSYDLDNIVAVSAVNTSDAICSKSDGWSYGSNYGANSVDIAAPGHLIRSAASGDSNAYCYMSGTSQATPYVTGALALLKAKYPNETYLQLIQRLYTGADTVSALSGKVVKSRRLNALKPLTVITAPTVSASKGSYADKVRVTWNAVSGASYYRVYRATSASGTKTALGSGWQTGTTYDDTSAVKGQTYYYFAKSATSSSGANASEYSGYATGWIPLAITYPDAWDPNDDTISGTTNVLTMSTTARTQNHGLSATDIFDYAKVYLTAGNTYVFETSGSCSVSGGDGDMYGVLYSAASTNSQYQVAYGDDIAYPSNRNYRITYTPSASGYYYLRSTTFLRGKSANYALRYQQKVSADRWDPGDNTGSGATALVPSTTEQQHGTHTLSDSDQYDWFKISMTAGRTYTFESLCGDSTYDLYGELFDSTLATDAHRVAYDDDSGSQSLQFKISYTPTTSGTYYLRARHYRSGATAVYTLKYSVSIPNSHDFVYYRNSAWSDMVVMANVTNATTGATQFTPNDTIYVTYGFTDECDNDILTAFTNTIQLVQYASADATDFTVLGSTTTVFPRMRAGTYWTDRNVYISEPSAGYYGVRILLNSPRSVTETNYVNNVRIARYSVVAAGPDAKTLTDLAVAGPSAIVGGDSGNYTATATFDDGTTADVTDTANWSSSGDGITGISRGVVSTEEVSASGSVTIQVDYTYNGVAARATKTVKITSSDTSSCPVGPAVVYPISPMTIYAQVMLDDEAAEEGDVLGAYVGDECRGYLELHAGGKGPINVYVTSPSEKLTFKCWSPRFEEGENLFVCNAQLAGEIGGELGSPTSPYKVDCYSSDPYGVPVQYPNPPMTIVAKVVIKGEPAARGDMVGVFCGNELRAKGAVRLEDGIAKITLSPSVSAAGEKLTFKVWDASESELLNAAGSVTAAVGGDVGSPESRYLIEVSDIVTQAISLNSSTWQFVSFNVVPTNPAPKAVFAAQASDIDRVTCGDKVFKPSWGDSDNTLGDIAVGNGYWIKRKTSGNQTLSVAGMPGDVAATVIQLSAGWNSVGYVPQQAGAIRSVLANALAAGAIDRVTSGDQVFKPSWSDGDNTLTTMTPGKGYWIKATAAAQFVYVEPSGSGAASALAAIAGEGAEHPFGDDRDTDVTSGVLMRAKLNLWGTDAVYGDAWVAAYANGSTIPCSVAQVNMNGNLIMNIGKLPAFTLTFKVYDSISRRLYDSPTVIAFAQGEDEKENQTITVSGAAPTYRVVFDLDGENGGSGRRVGGGALTQMVARASSATAPGVSGNPGYEFYLWDADFSNVKCDLTVHAIYRAVEIETTVISFDANQGSGGPLSVTATNSLPMPAVSELPVRSGFKFLGYFDAPEDGTQYYTATLASARDWDRAAATATLYAHWQVYVPDPAVYAEIGPGCEDMGVVTGGGKQVKQGDQVALKAVAKSGYVFAGWYEDSDFTTPAEANADYRNPGIVVTVGEDVLRLYARFLAKGDDYAEVLGEDSYEFEKGAEIDPVTIAVDSGSLPTVSVSGLPAGLTFVAKTNTIYGKPTKSGIFTATVKVQTVGKATASKALKFIVRGENETLVNVEYDADCGKVTGMGICKANGTVTLKATPVKGQVFAGWYYDEDYELPVSDTGVDYRSTSLRVDDIGTDQTLYAWFVDADLDDELEASVDEQYDLDGECEIPLDILSFSLPTVTVKGLPAGLKFNSKSFVIYGTPTKPGVYTVTLSLKNVTVKKPITQTFTLNVANIESPYLDVDYSPDAYVYRGGVRVGWNIGECATNGFAVTAVAGLPAGLKFNAKTGEITGVPTKAGAYTATVTLKRGSEKSSATITLNVEAIPAWAYGTFDGGSPFGQVHLTIANTGKLSGKYLADGITYTLTATAFASGDEYEYVAEVLASYSYREGRQTIRESETWKLSLYEDDAGGTLYCESEDDWKFEAYQNLWSQKDWKARGLALFGKSGKVMTLTGADYGLGENEKVTLTIKPNGTVAAKGTFDTDKTDRLGNPVAYSASAAAVVCAKGLEPFDSSIYLYFPPNESKGFAGYAWEVPFKESPLYLVIDLSGGASAASYPVQELSEMPEAGWTDEFKTEKLVLRRIDPGTFKMGSPAGELGRSSDEVQHSVTLTKTYYMGVFEVTQRQWELVTGNRPSYFNNSACYAKRPVEQVSYDDIRGASAGDSWPESSEVDDNSFLGRLRAKTGLDSLDLPTEAQWEYACRAGTTTALNNGRNLTRESADPAMSEVGRYLYNEDWEWVMSPDRGVGVDELSTAYVGTYLPNAWGLYDMHGNVWEWCLDWYVESLGRAAVTDPVGPTAGSIRSYRGGTWHGSASVARSASRGNLGTPDKRDYNIGLRLAMVPEL